MALTYKNKINKNKTAGLLLLVALKLTKRGLYLPVGADDCDFDFADGMCHWSNDQSSSSDFKWLLGSGSTPSSLTGPSADHTSGAGKKLPTNLIKKASVLCERTKTGG